MRNTAVATKVCNLLVNTFIFCFFFIRSLSSGSRKLKRKTPLSPREIFFFLQSERTDSTHANNSFKGAILLLTSRGRVRERAQSQQRNGQTNERNKNKRSEFILVWWQFIACLVIVMLTGRVECKLKPLCHIFIAHNETRNSKRINKMGKTDSNNVALGLCDGCYGCGCYSAAVFT